MCRPKHVSASPIVLMHGGLDEDMDAERFWVRPGIVAALEGLGRVVVAPDRDTTPSSWAAAATQMAGAFDRSSTVVAGSNGVSVALRLALDHPGLVSKLVLLWPATAGDKVVDDAVSARAAHLLEGETVRGVMDAELGRLELPVAVMASDPPTRVHQHATVESLVELIPGAVRIDGDFPESPRPDFAGSLQAFVAVLGQHL